jgi:SAM-dependent methyltransferase
MHDRHTNRERYFNEQCKVTEKYVIPYINAVIKITPDMVVAEIGCGEAGNLKPFLDMGCRVVGIDLSESKIENGKKYFANHPNKDKITLIAEDIYKVNPNSLPAFDLVVMRDTIEHIPEQEKFLGQLKQFLKPGAHVYFGFPPWRMPFGGHQQVCVSKFLSKLPYFHILPRPIYKGILKLFGESEGTITNLMEVCDTRISTARFERIVKNNGYTFARKNLYLINPNYEIKFGLKVRQLPAILNIPYLRDSFATTYYSVIKYKD